MKYLLILILALCYFGNMKSQIVINEFSSANYFGFTDEDGDNVDWIELYNSSESSIDLSGYYLSDDILNLQKWQFSSYIIPAKSHLLVCASGKNQINPPLIWNTVINWGDIMSYIIPEETMGDEWKLAGYDDTSWSNGKSGFGYGDDDDSTVIDTCLSVFIRKEFQIDDVADVKRMVLHLDYDDGFIAYINGIEVERSYLGEFGVPVEFDDRADEHESNIHRGMAPERFEILNLQNMLVSGTNVLAIQVHNNYSGSSDLTAIPFLTIGYSESDNVGSTHQYFSVSNMYFHTNFKIDSDGEFITLSAPNNSIIDQIDSLYLPHDISYGRSRDGDSNFLYFSKSTPGVTNNNGIGANSVTEDTVIYSLRGGFYSDSVYLELSSINSADQIYYTLDGSLPNQSNYLYSAPIYLTSDTIVKARIFRNNSLPGPINGNTYIIGRQHKFPVTCLSTDPDNLWDEQTGIYVEGTDASETMPHYGANYWEDWEKPAHFEMYDTIGEKVVDQGVGIKIYGGYTRTHPQKSLALFARKKYGKGSFKYSFFNDKTIDDFESILLRNSGQDASYSMFRDGLCMSLAREMDMDWLAYQPTAHYLNGKYWGILNIREKNNEHYLADNHLFNTKDLTIYKNRDVIMGTNEDYEALMSHVMNSELQTASNYQKVVDQIDVDNYIQYQLSQIYLDNGDWPGNNLKFWRVNTSDSKWRWIFYDADYTFGIYYWNGYTHNTLAAAIDTAGANWPNPEWSTRLFRRLLTSTQFRNSFINQYCDQLNTTFTPEHIISNIDSLQNLFDGEVQMHLERWDYDYNDWVSQVNKLREYATKRPEYAWSQLTEQFGLGNNFAVTIAVDDSIKGLVKMHSMVLDQKYYTGYYYQNVPIRLKALPKPGYKFANWTGSVISDTTEIIFDMSSEGNFTATFIEATDDDVDIVINEINYKSASNFDTEDWVELYNNGDATVDLAGWELTDLGVGEGYMFPVGTVIYPGDYLVVCDAIRSFRNYRTSRRNSIGNFKFGLSKSEDFIRLYNNKGELKDSVDYLSYSTWPTIQNESGGTIELISPDLDNSQGESWVINDSYGTPGYKNLSIISTQVKNKKVGLNVFNCFPNPFKEYTTIEFSVKEKGWVSLDIYDLNGRKIQQLINRELDADTYYYDWNAPNNGNEIQNGIYIVRLQSAGYNSILKVVKK